MKSIKPIFIFSLPRSGSTLVQRILATDKKIDTISEPWMLLQFLYPIYNDGIYSDFGYKLMSNAIEDFYNQLPNGLDDYLKELRFFILNLYTKASKKESLFFVDKTPRYHLIAEEIINLFPEGKFIFLWRNPLSIAASIVQSFCSGRWGLYRFNIDLYKGFSNLIKTYINYKDKAYAVRYEDLINTPNKSFENLFNYLGLSLDSDILNNFSKTKLFGRMGDNGGIANYKSISSEPLDKWKHILNNPIRKKWARNYLNWVGSERLKLIGYDLNSLLNELKTVKICYDNFFPDFFTIIYGSLNCFFEFKIIKDKFKEFKDKDNKIHFHR